MEPTSDSLITHSIPLNVVDYCEVYSHPISLKRWIKIKKTHFLTIFEIAELVGHRLKDNNDQMDMKLYA